MSISVIADISTLSARRPDSNVTGLIYLSVNGRSFPDAQWSDFPVIVLGWWLGGLTELARREVATYEARFMDGPYSFDLHLQDSQTARLTLNAESESWSCNIDFHTLYTSITSACALIISECKSRGWNNSDLELLMKSVAASTNWHHNQ